MKHLLLALLLSTAANAQTAPEIQPESELFRLRADLQTCQADLSSALKSGRRIMDAKDSRIAATAEAGNIRIAGLKQALHATQAERDSLVSVTVKQAAVIDVWVPKTKAGVFTRKIRNGLAIICPFAVGAVWFLVK